MNLIDSSEHGLEKMVAKLLVEGADPNERGRSGETPLIMACLGGHLEVIQALLIGGADPNARTDKGSTALMVSSDRADTRIVQLLLKSGADVESKDSIGRTALLRAERKGHHEIVDLLMEVIADSHKQDGEDKAKEQKNEEEDHKTRYHENDEFSGLRQSRSETSRHGSIPLLLFLVVATIVGVWFIKDFRGVVGNRGPDIPKHTRPPNQAPLSQTYGELFRRYPKIVHYGRYGPEILLHEEKRVWRPSTSNRVKALLSDATNCRTHLVARALRTRINMNSKDRHGRTAISLAAEKGCLKTVELLLNHSDPNLSDRNGMTPLMWACKMGRYDVIEMLAQRGANLSPKDKKGKTALAWVQDHFKAVMAQRTGCRNRTGHRKRKR